jgi:hypothetical protein
MFEMAKSAAERQRECRARKKIEKQSQEAVKAEQEKYLIRHAENLAWAQEQDAKPTFYKSECRSCVDLLAIFEGTNILDKENDDEDEEEDGSRKARKTKKENRPNPSMLKVAIRAVTSGDVKIEPTCLRGCRHDQMDGTCAVVYRNTFDTILDSISGKFIPLNGDVELTFGAWLALRDKARKDLLWLGRLLGKGLFHSVHQYICDQFVKKNFDGMYFPQYSLDDFHEMVAAQKRYANFGTGVQPGVLVETREMILLEPRGGYKSTIDGIDAVQWLINCPDIRVMIMTAVRRLAKKFAREIKRYFYLPLRAEPTAFHVLFPEYILSGREGRSEDIIKCPARNVWGKEDSLWVTSAESVATGDHCDILKGDDVVDPKNSANEEMRAELKFMFDSIKNDLRDGWGFIDVCGTCYFTDDYYGTRLKPSAETKRVAPVLFSRRGSWTLSAFDQIAYDAGKLTINEILTNPEIQARTTLTFPHKLGWSKLREIYDDKNDERSFKNQQLNEATDPKTDELFINHFDEDGLRAHTYARSAAPQNMQIIQSWDTAYSDKKSSDFSVGATIGIYNDKYNRPAMVVLDVLYGQWKASELSFHFLNYYRKHNPSHVFIEDTNGTDHFLDMVKAECLRVGCDLPSKWRVRPISNARGAKRLRIMDLQFLYSQDRLWFVDGWWTDELRKQFIKYKGTRSTAYTHDDIPDAIALALDHLPRTALKFNPDPKEVEKEHEERMSKEIREGWNRRLFGSDSPTKPKPPVVAEQPATPSNPRAEQLKKLIGKILPPGMRY